jgi:anthranilate/para-aminobenzoate synthase component I
MSICHYLTSYSMELPIFNIYQIHFNAQSLSNCSNHPYVKLYNNSEAPREERKYFENSVIANSLPHGGKYFGVWSWKAAQKIRLAGNAQFSFEQMEGRLEMTDKSVIAFHHNSKKLAIFHNSEGLKLNRLFNTLMEGMKYEYRAGEPVRCAIMQNHFLMKVESYKDYVKELRRAIQFINDYLEPEASEKSPYRKHDAIWYPYHTFILERFASAYVLQNKLDFTYYKDIPA